MYVGKPFNGVLFLLREPHINDEIAKEKKEAEEKQDEEKMQKILTKIQQDSDDWIEKVLRESFPEKEWQGMKRKDRSAANHYRNRIREIIGSDQIRKIIDSVPGSEEKKKVDQIAYTNLNENGGGSVVGEEYKKILDVYSKEKFDGLIERFGPELKVVFTCRDIFHKLVGELKPDSLEDGLIYQCTKGESRWRKFSYTSARCGTIAVYEIWHPSRSPRIKGDY